MKANHAIIVFGEYPIKHDNMPVNVKIHGCTGPMNRGNSSAFCTHQLWIGFVAEAMNHIRMGRVRGSLKPLSTKACSICGSG